MKNKQEEFNLKIQKTKGTCPIGETVGNQNMAENKIPVLSCEGACIRGEIARLAANQVAKNDPFRRSCHGELLTVPHSAIADWTKNAQKVVVIDGCFLKCHARILRNLIDKDRLIEFDALPIYKKYTDIFNIDDVPEAERKEVAQKVADRILADLNDDAWYCSESNETQAVSTCKN
ncbi:putative zinc-binding protein [candidate division KSB1 bacterium]